MKKLTDQGTVIIPILEQDELSCACCACDYDIFYVLVRLNSISEWECGKLARFSLDVHLYDAAT